MKSFNINKLVISCAALVGAVGIAASAGLFWGYPIVGGSSYCISYQNPTVVNGVVTSQGTCTSTAPAGPSAMTGNELLIADTQLPGGQTPQTVYMPSGFLTQHGQGSSRNALIGGDFVTNLWQRGTTPISATTAATAAYSADRWAVYSSGNTLTVTRDVTAADVLPSAGVNGIAKVTRPSGTNTTSICIGQVLPTSESARFVGNEAIFSFYAEALAGYLQTNSTITANIAVYTGADSATVNAVTDAFMKGTQTGYTVLTGTTPSTIAVPTTSNTTSGTAIPLTTSLVRYSVAAYVPTQVLVSSTLTNVTGIGVILCTGAYPASTGVATDGFAFGNAQLETASPGTQVGGVLVASPITTPGSFARRAAADEAILQYGYTQPAGYGTEVATVYGQVANCTASGNVNSPAVFVPPLRTTPATATSTLTAGGWSIKTAATIVAIGTITIVGASKYSATINSTAACTTTLPYTIVGTNTTGLILFVAEP